MTGSSYTPPTSMLVAASAYGLMEAGRLLLGEGVALLSWPLLAGAGVIWFMDRTTYSAPTSTNTPMSSMVVAVVCAGAMALSAAGGSVSGLVAAPMNFLFPAAVGAAAGYLAPMLGVAIAGMM